MLLLISCCWWGQLWRALPPLRALWANSLTPALGQVEVLAPGQLEISTVKRAPDGRHLVMGWVKKGDDALEVWDVASGQRQPIQLLAYDWRWLNATYIAMIGGGSYWVVDARDASMTEVTPFPEADYKKPGGIVVVETVLRAADQVYILETFGSGAGYKVITQSPEQWHVFNVGYGDDLDITRAELETALNAIPHTEVPILGWGGVPQTNQRVYSPNRQFYMTRENVDQSERRVVIYTRDGVLVASAHKAGWFPYVSGWAHDSSGVYFQLHYQKAMFVAVPETPIFKLSPLTPEEQRWAEVKRSVTWAAVGAVVAGGGWWLWRRRRSRRIV
jgi:hypothetical protein